MRYHNYEWLSKGILGYAFHGKPDLSYSETNIRVILSFQEKHIYNKYFLAKKKKYDKKEVRNNVKCSKTRNILFPERKIPYRVNKRLVCRTNRRNLRNVT